MNKIDEILVISQNLTELKLKQKMLSWMFHNGENLPEEKMNAILDEKNRIDKFIETLENRLRELEK